MIFSNEICSKCHENFMNCKCEQFHPNGVFLNDKEIEALRRVLKDEFINYEDQEVHEVLNKLFGIKKNAKILSD